MTNSVHGIINIVHIKLMIRTHRCLQGRHSYSYTGMLVVVFYLHMPWITLNTTGVISGAGTAYPSGASEFTPGY